MKLVMNKYLVFYLLPKVIALNYSSDLGDILG